MYMIYSYSPNGLKTTARERLWDAVEHICFIDKSMQQLCDATMSYMDQNMKNVPRGTSLKSRGSPVQAPAWAKHRCPLQLCQGTHKWWPIQGHMCSPPRGKSCHDEVKKVPTFY